MSLIGFKSTAPTVRTVVDRGYKEGVRAASWIEARRKMRGFGGLAPSALTHGGGILPRVKIWLSWVSPPYRIILLENDQNYGKEAKSIGDDDTQLPQSKELDCAAAEIREKFRDLCMIGRRTLTMVIELGGLLQDHKESVKEAGGKWENYAENVLGIPVRSASNYMRIYNNRETLEKSEKFSEIGMSGGIALLRAEETGAKAKKPKPKGPIGDKSNSTGSKIEPTDSGEKKSPPPFELAGDSKLPAEEVKWTHGIIERNEVNNALKPGRWSNFEVDTNRKSDFQTLLIQIAAPINAAFPESTKKDAEHARRVIEKLLRMLDKIEHPEKKKKN